MKLKTLFMLNNLKSTLKSIFFAKILLVMLAFRCGSLVGIFLRLIYIYINFSKKKIWLHPSLSLGSLTAVVFLCLWKTPQAAKKGKYSFLNFVIIVVKKIFPALCSMYFY